MRPRCLCWVNADLATCLHCPTYSATREAIIQAWLGNGANCHAEISQEWYGGKEEEGGCQVGQQA